MVVDWSRNYPKKWKYVFFFFPLSLSDFLKFFSNWVSTFLYYSHKGPFIFIFYSSFFSLEIFPECSCFFVLYSFSMFFFSKFFFLFFFVSEKIKENQIGRHSQSKWVNLFHYDDDDDDGCCCCCLAWKKRYFSFAVIVFGNGNLEFLSSLKIETTTTTTTENQTKM